jgi:hypothetical protein
VIATTRARLCILISVLIGVAPLGAQSAPERTALQLFRDTLAITTDTLTLHHIEARNIDAAKAHRDDPIPHIRLGFIALRINELGGSLVRVDNAASEFEWAAELKPNWPYPWFGLGLAEARAPNRAQNFGGGLWTMLGIDRDTRAGTAFAHAIKADPGFVDGLIAFAEVARNQRINAPLHAALDALRLAQASSLAWDPTLLLERGRLERLAGSPDSARVAFRRALLLDIHPAMASLELARTIPLTADTVPSGRGQLLPVEVAYYTGASSDEPEVVAMYRRDIQPIVDDTVLAQFDRVRGAARVAWLQEFWRKQGAIDMRSPGARLSEHFRRWDQANRLFRLPPFRRSYRWGIETYHSHDTDLDDRGVVWLRQGAPKSRIVWPTSEPRERSAPRTSALRRTPPIPGSLIIDPLVVDRTFDAPTFGNETWRYARPDGDIVLNFAAQDDPDDYRLVESILQLDVSFSAMLDHSSELPGIAELIRAGPMSRPGLANEERLAGKRNISLATTTSSWTRTYSITMGGRVQWLMAGTRNGVPLVHIVYGVDAAMLRILPLDRRGLIPIRVRAIFLDDHGNPVASLDTLQLMRRPTLQSGLVAARAEVPVPAGSTHMRLNVEANGAIGTIYPLDSLSVPDVGSGVLGLSSILFGTAGRSLAWPVTPDDTVWLAPQNSFVASDTLAVFVEGYGLHPGTSYVVHLGLTRQRGVLARLIRGKHESVTLTERLTFGSQTGQIRRAISLKGLEPGKYELQVQVEGGGKSVLRRRTLIIEETRL